MTVLKQARKYSQRFFTTTPKTVIPAKEAVAKAALNFL